MKTFFCPIERKEITLPKNLYTDNRGRYGKWRYKGPDGVKVLSYYVKSIGGKPTVDMKEIDSATAIQVAQALNKKHYGNAQAEKERHKVVAGRMPYYIEQYIETREAEDTDEEFINKKHWQNQKYLLLQFGRAFKDVPISKITLPMLEDWWMTRGEFAAQTLITATSQRKRKVAMARLFSWLMARDLLPGVKGNPFKQGNDYEFGYRPMPKKKRNRLTLKAFLQIQKHAEEEGEHMLVTAMALGLFTKLRREDLCQLKFEDCLLQGNTVFRSKITKWENQHQEEVWNEWKLGEHPDLQAALLGAIETSMRCYDYKQRTRTPYILHKQFRHSNLRTTAKAHTKDHACQVTGDYLGKCFAKFRDAAPEIAALPAEQKPTFHEIRALGASLELKSGFDLQTVSESMNHTDTSITEIYTSGHEVKVVQVKSRVDLEKVKIVGE